MPRSASRAFRPGSAPASPTALPSAWCGPRRRTLLLVGCGDVGSRVLRELGLGRLPGTVPRGAAVPSAPVEAAVPAAAAGRPGRPGHPGRPDTPDPVDAAAPATATAATATAVRALASAPPAPHARRPSPWRVIALTSSAGRQAELRGLGVLPVVGDLDRPRTLARWRALAALGDALLHLAPPPASGACDTRSRHLRATLAMAPRLRRVVYGSTTGVYGDAGGAWVDETRPVAPATDRARRRVDAEACWREAARRRARMAGRTGHGGHAGHGGHPAAAPPWTVLLLRIPGIYAADRAGGHPSERLRRGTPVLRPEDDVHTNHIHADDLARACVAALWRGGPQRVVHVSDDTELTMGAYFRLAAELCDLPAPPQISRAEAARSLGPMQLSFMGESRRLRNRRLKAELRLRLRHPTVHTGLLDGWPAADPAAGPA